MQEKLFLSPDKLSVVRVPDFFKKYFLSQNYYLLPNNHYLKNLIIFLNLKILRKIRLVFKLLKNLKFKFTNPGEFKNIIFDDYSTGLIDKLLPKNSYFILVTRIENFKEIYISKEILIYIFINFFKRSLKLNYIYKLIEIIKPKNIITTIDNSMDFHIISHLLKDKKEISFYAFQGAYRHESYLRQILQKFNYNGYYFTFGDYEIDSINKINKNQNINIKSKPTGSLRVELAKDYFKKKNIIPKKEYDICLISEATFSIGAGTQFETSSINNSINAGSMSNKDYLITFENKIKLANYVFKFCKKYKKKLLVLGRGRLGAKNNLREVIFYNQGIKDKSFKIDFFDKSKYEHFKKLMQCDLVIGKHSSLLRESFGLNKKTLVCDWTTHLTEDIYFPGNGIHKLNSDNFSDFERRVLMLLSINYEEYLLKVQNVSSIYNNSLNLNEIKEELT